MTDGLRGSARFCRQLGARSRPGVGVTVTQPRCLLKHNRPQADPTEPGQRSASCLNGSTGLATKTWLRRRAGPTVSFHNGPRSKPEC